MYSEYKELLLLPFSEFFGYAWLLKQPCKKILVVEDDPFMKAVIPRLIRNVNDDTNVNWASSFEVAAEILNRDTNYDLVIADYRLEGLKNGIDLYNHCQKHYPKIPFIVISGLSLQSIRSQSRVCAPKFAYLSNPLQVKQFRYELEKFI